MCIRDSFNLKCFTNGQWLEMKATTTPCSPSRSAKETFKPSVSESWKSGAGVPKGNMVEGVAAILYSFIKLIQKEPDSYCPHAMKQIKTAR